MSRWRGCGDATGFWQAVCAVVFLVIALWAARKSGKPLKAHDWLQVISAGLECLILFLYPIMTVILSAVLYKRAISRKVMAAMGFCYAGIALVLSGVLVISLSSKSAAKQGT